jgi:membrane protein
MYLKIKNLLSHIVKSLKYSIIDTVLHDGVEHAGYLAFLFILSLFPFLIFFVSIIALASNLDSFSTIFSQMANQIQDTDMISSLINSIGIEKLSSAVTPRIEEITSGPPQSVLTIAFIGIIWTASSAIEGIRTILNRAYRIDSLPPYIWRRLLSIGQFIFFVFFLLIVSSIFITYSFFDISNFNQNLISLKKIITILISIKIIAFIYYVIPNTKQKFKNTLPGALICVILFWLILKLFTIYLQNFNQFNLLYGSLAGIVATLMFFFFVALAFITGAEFNYHFNNKKDK